MKKRLLMTVLVTAVLISGLLIFISCDKKETSPVLPPTTIIQIQSPNSDGQGTQVIFDYEVSFEPVIEFHGEAFPVKALSTAAAVSWNSEPRMVNWDNYIGDVIGDFGISVLLKGSSEEKVPIMVEIEGDRFIMKSKLDASIPLNSQIEIFPRIVYNYDALARLAQPASENVYFRLYYGSVKLTEKIKVVRFHSVNEVPLAEINRWDGESIIEHKWLFAAYVNEDDPLIDEILKEALKLGTVNTLGLPNNGFTGYQIKDSDGESTTSVIIQALAVWSVFLHNNVKYSNITTTSTGSSSIATQYVRTLGESYRNSQANCVDGSVLFASILRKIGIETFLVLVPGHMFVGFIENEEPASVGFLETTMLGNVDISKYTKDNSFWGKIKNTTGLGTTQAKAIRDSFLAAYQAGWEQYLEAADYLNDDDNSQYQIIDISSSRSMGIMPIVRY